MLAIKAAARRHDGCANARAEIFNPANATFSHPFLIRPGCAETCQGSNAADLARFVSVGSL
jgi:hypothetical protein